MTLPPSGPGQHPPPLVLRPLDPLPARLPDPTTPTPARLPVTARILLLTVLALGNPWATDLIHQVRYALPDADGTAGLLVVLAVTILVAASWPTWDPRPTDPDTTWLWLAGNLRTLLFLIITIWLLRRLATTAAPTALWRTLALLAAPLLGATGGTLAAALTQLLLDDPLLRGTSLIPSVLTTLTGGLYFCVLSGALLAWAASHTHLSDPERG
ncbi:hypothetical protein ABT336_23335 [Micromonospora sp. NPDC000207]|uniref:hypothetical protein n=1 Tax=Micromonospora sp. NPDC000207 TaxID=3154246 RepID=UPI00331F009E